MGLVAFCYISMEEPERVWDVDLTPPVTTWTPQVCIWTGPGAGVKDCRGDGVGSLGTLRDVCPAFGPAPGRGTKAGASLASGGGTARIPEHKVCGWAVRSASARRRGLLPPREKLWAPALGKEGSGRRQENGPFLRTSTAVCKYSTRNCTLSLQTPAAGHHQCEEWGQSPLPHPHPTPHPAQAPGGLRTDAGEALGAQGRAER